MLKVLSTKKLSSKQQECVANSSIILKDYNAISIEKLPVKDPFIAENAIVTSQNAAKILIQSKAVLDNVFCVGEKTSALLTQNKYRVVTTADKASLLANYILTNYKNNSFVFFCGDKRRDELPEILSKNNVAFTEKTIYKTSLNIHKFELCFDAVLFFSPSAVQSYVKMNSLKKTIAFCIGKTTANEAEKYALKTIVSKQASIETTIGTLISYFKV